MAEIHVIRNQDLFVPHRIVKVGQAIAGGRATAPVPPDTVKDPVGRAALARAHEAIRDVPKREKIITVGQAGESAGVNKMVNKAPSLMPQKTGDVYPGEHRYAYQLQQGDTLLHLGDPDTLIGRYVKIHDVQVAYIEHNGKRVAVNARIEGTTETGNRVVLDMQGNAQVRLVTNKKEPTR